MQFDRDKTAAFSGHRTFKMAGADGDLFGGGACDAGELTARTAEAVAALHEQGYDTFLCGMAEGFDLLAAGAVLDLKRQSPGVKLIAVVPHRNHRQSFRNELREIYDDIIERADKVVIVCERYSHDCFHRRNDFMVDRSSALVCYYNGSKGGTQYTVKQAIRQGLRIINLA